MESGHHRRDNHSRDSQLKTTRWLHHLLKALSIVVLLAPQLGVGQTAPKTQGLEGLWYARKVFGPHLAGRMVIERTGDTWRASLAGTSARARVIGDTLEFEMPGSRGSFRGYFDRSRRHLSGQWTVAGRFLVTPLEFAACGIGCYAASVVPPHDEFNMYLKVSRRPDGTYSAFLRNPERNLGRWIRVDHLDVHGDTVVMLDAKGERVTAGVLQDGVLSAPMRGGTYDFERVPDTAYTDFYPRGYRTSKYDYVPPRDEHDGWPVARLTDVALDSAKLREMLQLLSNDPGDSLGALMVHGVLIARHGKLVLDEYFFGEHGDRAHETRSGGKVTLTVTMGAAMQQGVNISPQTRVYDVMRPRATNLDPRKRALTVEHLLNMASGYDCDDNGDDHPGNEDTITNQDNPDWYSVILDLKMIRDPGAEAVYCSINPHLAGGVLTRVAGRSLQDLHWELIGKPLHMRNYFMPLAPLGAAYMGGMMRYRLRDWAKLGQLWLNGGVWEGKRIVSADWVKQSTVDRYPMGTPFRYGYLWWMIDYPYQGRKIRAYFASGNGGNEMMVFPQLDMVVTWFGANYNERAGWAAVTELVPRYILPAVRQ